jgi:2-polyprenyl-6-methoxyphenol hydroxylase-like FAD-dependent oxidoreductase
MSGKRLSTSVCVAGGGPAGMMLGLLLARAGIDVVVLEKHKDFFRDFRGDTIHPSTVDLIDQLGLQDRFDSIPHTSVASVDAVIKGVRFTPVDFRSLRRGANRLVLMPQWDLLDLLSSAARELPTFRLLMEAEATSLLHDGDRVAGVAANTADGELQIDALLTVAADGRSSALRAASGLPIVEYGVPIDVLWFRLPRPQVNPPDTIAYITNSSVVITIPRTGYYQTAMLIRKDSYGGIKSQGLESFRDSIVDTVPFLEPSVGAVTDWADIKLLSVQINRLKRWHQRGFLSIGDAAHAMSPAFGVGINYAIQDAVAAANLLVEPLRAGSLTEKDLTRVQKRREPPVRKMQAIQRTLHNVVGKPGGGAALPSPRVLRRIFAVTTVPFRPVIARVIGRGFRPERINPNVLSPSAGVNPDPAPSSTPTSCSDPAPSEPSSTRASSRRYRLQ